MSLTCAHKHPSQAFVCKGHYSMNYEHLEPIRPYPGYEVVKGETTELHYISGDRALGCRVSPKTWRL